MRRNPPSRAQVQCWSIAPPGAAIPVRQPEQTRAPVRHGYSLAAIDRIVTLGIMRSYGWRAGDVEERTAAARLAVIEHLYGACDPPTREDLVNTARAADHDHVGAEMREHGVQRAERGGGVAPNFERYWWGAAHNTPSHENGIVERVAVHQILPALTGAQRDAVDALADCQDYQLAAKALRIGASALDMRLASARARFGALWFEGETPQRRVRRDRRVWSRTGTDGSGRRRLTVSQVERVRERKHAGELVRDMAAELGVAPQTLHALLRGAKRPAPDPEGV